MSRRSVLECLGTLFLRLTRKHFEAPRARGRVTCSGSDDPVCRESLCDGGGPKTRQVRGFTLLEALVSMTILASSIVGITYSISQSSHAATRGIRLQQAVELAGNQLAMAVARADADPVDEAGADDRFQWKIRFEEKDYGVILASVEVQWQEKGRSREYMLSEIYVPRSLMSGGQAQ